MKHQNLQSHISQALINPELDIPKEIGDFSGNQRVKRFNVYRNNVISSLIEVLSSTFPVTCKLTGEQFFKASASEYIRSHPPKSPVILEYGDTFSQFLFDFQPAKTIPYLSDIARLEYAWMQAYHCKDEVSASIHELSKIEPSDLERLILTLHPSVNVISSEWPIVSIWRECTEHATGIAPEMTIGEIGLISRPNAFVFVKVITPESFILINYLLMKKPLGYIQKQISQLHPEMDLSIQLANAFENGFISNLKLE